MGLGPFEWEVTPAEAVDLVHGYNRRQEIRHEERAWVVGHLLGIDPRKLLPREPQTDQETLAVMTWMAAHTRTGA